MAHVDVEGTGAGSRACSECGRVLARTPANFHVDPSCADFLRGVCRDCTNAQRRARYRRDPEPVRARERQRRAARTQLMKDSPMWRQTGPQEATRRTTSVATDYPER